MKKQLALALTAGVAATGAVVASAATLGGVSAKDLGASTQVIASCQQTGTIAVDYTTSYDSAAADYNVSTVKITGIDGTHCAGEYYTVVLSKGSTGAYSKLSSTVNQLLPAAGSDGTITVTLNPANVKASDLSKISLLITSSSGAQPANA